MAGEDRLKRELPVKLPKHLVRTGGETSDVRKDQRSASRRHGEQGAGGQDWVQGGGG
jgi:hypothetical protein